MSDKLVESCPYCGADRDPKDDLFCPRCYRDGCYSCMPAGRNCLCPECEERGEPVSDPKSTNEIITEARVVEVGGNKHGDPVVILRVDQETAKQLAGWLYEEVNIRICREEVSR